MKNIIEQKFKMVFEYIVKNYQVDVIKLSHEPYYLTITPNIPGSPGHMIIYNDMVYTTYNIESYGRELILLNDYIIRSLNAIPCLSDIVNSIIKEIGAALGS